MARAVGGPGTKATEIELADDVVAKVAAITEPVKDCASSSCDLWQSESRMEK